MWCFDADGGRRGGGGGGCGGGGGGGGGCGGGGGGGDGGGAASSCKCWWQDSSGHEALPGHILFFQASWFHVAAYGKCWPQCQTDCDACLCLRFAFGPKPKISLLPNMAEPGAVGLAFVPGTAVGRHPSRARSQRPRQQAPFASSEETLRALAVSGAVLAARCGIQRRAAKSDATMTLEPTRPSQKSHQRPTGPLVGDVFLIQTPLILPSPLPSSIAQVLPKHSVVLAGVDGGYAAFDFVPATPDDPSSAVQLLLGGSVEGLFGVRRLRGLPRGAVRLGQVAEGATVEDVLVVNESFDKMLSLTANDCNSYSQSVLRAILAEPDKMVQERLFSTLDLEEMDSSSKVQYKEPSVTNAVVLVAGTTVGAGILALPAVTQSAGFVPSTLALTFSWLYMAVTGLFIAEVACRTMAATGKRATSLQSMAAGSIGPAGAWLSSAAFVFLHMALLIAYCSRGGELLTSLPLGFMKLSSGLPKAGGSDSFLNRDTGSHAEAPCSGLAWRARPCRLCGPLRWLHLLDKRHRCFGPGEQRVCCGGRRLLRRLGRAGHPSRRCRAAAGRG